MRRAAGAVLCITALSACAYYNAMWSAERLANEARRLEARDREPEARSRWAGAAVKAASVMTRHPRSRWADDALVLRAEGLAGAGTCAAAAAPIAKALATVSDDGLHERAGLAAAQCALAANQPVEAERALTEALASDDARRRSRAHYLAGRAAGARLDYDGAVAHFGRSHEPGALPARVRALLEKDPFAGAPPRFVRGVVYDYHFTDRAERAATGAWWRREERGRYGPVLALEDGRLRAVEVQRP